MRIIHGLCSSKSEVGYRTIQNRFDPKCNSLNFLRLTLALCVIVSHTATVGINGRYIFGRVGDVDLYNQTSLGSVAVYGFFGISGFLIARSATHNNFGRYLWQRFLRIFPGFWVALILTAFLFGVLGWAAHSGYAEGVSLHRFVFGYQGAINFVVHNALLKMNQFLIFGAAWNASLWTLFYEFLCYLIVAGLILVRVMRRRAVVAGLAVALWAVNCVITWTPSFHQHFARVFENAATFVAVQMFLVRLATIFLVGMVVYLYRDRIPDSGWLALLCTGVFVAGLYIPTHGLQPEESFTSSDLLVPMVAYSVIWLGLHLPFQRVGAKNDYSYGVYIYAVPVQTLLLIWGVWHWGYAAYLSLTVLGTVPFAVASWWLIEKRALSLKKLDWAGVWAKLLGPPRSSRSVAVLDQPEGVSQSRSRRSDGVDATELETSVE